jgi:rod shape determining protein RodA
MFKKESRLKRFDFILLITTILLSVYGFIVINSATMSKLEGSEPYLKTQIIAFALGAAALFVLVMIDYDIYGSFYMPIYVLTNLLLLYTLINPVEASEWGDVRSWIAIGPIVFQPSEVAKFGVIISLAKFIDINKENMNHPLVLLKILLFAFLPVGLIMLQPDLGTALVFVFFIALMLYIAGLDRKYVLTILIIALILAIAGIAVFFQIMEDYTLGEDYRFDRIVTFFYPELDPDDTGYQVIQSKTAIGSGMIYGRGLYKGVQNQLGYLPTKETDFIFAVIGEELGLVGGLTLLCLYAVLLYRLIRGEVVKKGIDYLILENNSIGYLINTSFSTLERVSEKERATLLTYMHIREDILALYGFLTNDEIDLFKKLISVNGIGPKAGLSVLSTYKTDTVKEIILSEDTGRLSKVPGIGKKTAGKIILELKDKVGTIEELQGSEAPVANEMADVAEALTALGFAYAEVKRTLGNMDLTGKSENEIIKEALKNMNRQG